MVLTDLFDTAPNQGGKLVFTRHQPGEDQR
jgi:hypothetical protein